MQSPPIPQNERERLAALNALDLLDTPSEERFDRLTRLAKQLFGVPIALVSLIDMDRQWFKSKQGLDACETGRDISFCGHAVLSDAIFEITDASQDQRFADNPLVTGPPNIRFYAGAPLSSTDGYQIGTLCIIDEKPRQLTLDERAALRDLADLVEIECRNVITRMEQKNKHSNAQIQRQLEAFRLLNDLAASVKMETKEQLQRALHVGLDFLQLDIGIVSQIRGDEYKIFSVAAPPENQLHAGQAFKLSETYCDLVLKEEDLVALHYMGESEYRGHPCYQSIGLEAYIGVALEVEGLRYGTLNFSSVSSRNEPFTDGEKLFMRLLARWVSASIEREHAAEVIKQSESRLRGLFELSPIGIALNDYETGKFIDFNPAFLSPTGYTLEEFEQLSYWDITPKEYAAQEAVQIENLKSQGRYGPYEKEYIRKDGSRYPVLLNGMVLEDPNGGKLIWSIIEDISERKRIERMKIEFISTVSHELRTPLTAISGALGLLKGGVTGSLPEGINKMVEVAFKNSQRLNWLINDLLDMEKLLAGKMTFELREQTLKPLLDLSIETNQSYADQFQVQLKLLDCSPALTVKVDAARFAQIMANLLSNAAKFSPEGGRVEIRAVKDAKRIRVVVRDYGEGIPEAFHKQIFQKFSQADSSDSRQKGGTGLGLAITRELIERMHGEIGFQSTTAGTEFFFLFPSK